MRTCRCTCRLLLAVLAVLEAPQSTPSTAASARPPRDHDFWATARQEYNGKKGKQRKNTGWNTGVSYAQGSLSYQGNTDDAIQSRRANEDSSESQRGGVLSPLDAVERLDRKLGHRKKDEGRENAWSLARFGPSMLLSGEV